MIVEGSWISNTNEQFNYCLRTLNLCSILMLWNIVYRPWSSTWENIFGMFFFLCVWKTQKPRNNYVYCKKFVQTQTMVDRTPRELHSSRSSLTNKFWKTFYCTFEQPKSTIWFWKIGNENSTNEKFFLHIKNLPRRLTDKSNREPKCCLCD